MVQPDSDAVVVELTRETNAVADDQYLTEITDRILKLRALVGQREEHKRRPKRWENQ